METLGVRLRKLRNDKRLTQQQLGELTGVSKTSVIYWEKDENIPKHESLVALASALNTTTAYLLYGIQQVDTWDSSTPLDDDEVEIPFFKDFSFACGSGSINDAITHEKRRLRMSKATLKGLSIDKGNAVAATASGDSMSPTINDGDTIHIDLGRKTIKDGKIFAVSFGGLQYAKRLYNLPFGGVRIVSDNEDEFEEIRMTADEAKMQEFQIIGWIWQIAKLEKW